MHAYLPHVDPNSSERQRSLQEFRREYYFNYTYIPGYPFLDHVPKREKFSVAYWAGRFLSLTLLPFNIGAGKLKTVFLRPVTHISDFLNLFTLYRRPENIESWLSDEGFAQQRISGCNPQAIRRLEAVPADFPFTDAHLQAVAGSGRSIASEISAGALFIADFDSIAHVKGSTYKGQHRTIPAPKALFWWDHAAEKLYTIGIQVHRQPGARVFLPSDPQLDWVAENIS